eukprot:TRINITY_DN4352_c0_g1_i3.p2 TRINITY_DN4352_c0_g1~~TRINITY_DN4352_c0_g1_i3.p2  ORF type:complete len:360 (+),score=45.19 TRINITY_DN4352_c0_g1_i3:1-1080(+)
MPLLSLNLPKSLTKPISKLTIKLKSNMLLQISGGSQIVTDVVSAQSVVEVTLATPEQAVQQPQKSQLALQNSLAPLTKHDFFSKYELRRDHLLGKGIFGRVYVCRNRTTGIRYAAKFVGQDVLNISGGIKSLQQEGDVGRYLENTAKVRGTVRMIEQSPFEEKDGAYLVMELCEGKDLLTAALSQPAWSEKKLKIIFKQCLQIVHNMHAANVVHGDIKPQNFVFTSQQETPNCLRVVDFGSAQILANDSTVGPCKGGTKWYWGPEILEKKEVGKHTDVWGLGCMLCLLLTGNLPFGNAEDGFGVKWMTNLIQGQIVGLKGVYGVSESGLDLVRSMLVPDIESRPTCEQLLRHKWFQDNY